ncbi:uncharacterized protein NPIL_164981 [Nephila pilipes]|uniref:Uncharacterized protein n=1 Tax=Nephila pilipes TaxID=299642 RepID=A0A8X6PFU0_NEPPI|nr:uncharacterized protein NPIL_164981 [Nephila pilipes]
MKPNHLHVVQQLTKTDKQVRVSAAQILLKTWYIEPDIPLMFSDEAAFHKSGGVNKYNCIIWATEHPTEVRDHILDPSKLNVWCAFSKVGIIGPFCLPCRSILSTLRE